MPAAISWANRVTQAATVAIGGAATSHVVDPAYPLANLVDDDPSKEARATIVEDGVSSGQYMRATWAASSVVRVLHVANVYISSLTHLVSVQLRAVLAGVVQASGPVFTAADLVPRPGTTDRYDLFGLLSADTTADALDLLVTVAANQTLTYGGGFAWAAPALVVPAFARGWSLRPISGSEVDRGPSGAVAAQIRPSRKVLTAALEARTYQTILGTPGSPSAASLLALTMEAGVGSPVVAIVRSDDLHTLQVSSVFGLLSDLPEPTHQAGSLYRGSFRVEQIRG